MNTKKEVAVRFILQGVSKILAYALLLVLGNRFAPTEYGEAAYALSIFYILTSLLFPGLPNALVPALVKRRSTGRPALALFFLSLLCIPLGVALLPGWTFPLVLAVPFIYLHKLEQAIFLSRHKYILYQASYIAGLVATLVASFVFEGASGIIVAYAAGFILAPILFSGALAGAFRRGEPLGMREYLTTAFPVQLSVLSFMFLFWIDASILGFLAPPEDVGGYMIAGSIAGILAMVPEAISSFVLTRSSELGKKEGRLVLARSLRISFMLTLVLAIALLSCIGLFFRMFFPAYQIYAPAVALLAIGLAGFSVYFIIHNYYVGIGKPYKALGPIIAGVIANIILDILLIPEYGVGGVAFATMTAHLLVLTSLLAKSGMLRYQFFVLLPLPGIAYLAGIYGIILAPAAAIFLLLTGGITKEDLLVLKQALLPEPSP